MSESLMPVYQDLDEVIILLHTRVLFGVDLIKKDMDDDVITGNNGSGYCYETIIDPEHLKLFYEDTNEKSSIKAMTNLINRESTRLHISIGTGMKKFEDVEEIKEYLSNTTWKINVYSNIIAIDTTKGTVRFNLFVDFLKKAETTV